MDDEDGLQLGLSLAWCLSSSKSKSIGDNSSDIRAEESDRSSKLINDFKHFLEGGTRKLDSGTGSQRSEPSKREQEREGENINKRKFYSEEISNQKKHEREFHNPAVPERSRQSYISINTDDDSTAENEDVAESEVVGSTSKFLSHQENIENRYFDTRKEVFTVFDTSDIDVTGQRGFTITPDKEFRAGKVPYSVAYPSQPLNILNMPHPVSAKNGNVSAMFGYPSVQLPVLDKEYSWGLGSHLKQIDPSYSERFPSTSDKILDVPSKVPQVMQKSSEALQYSGTSVENTNKEPDKLSSEFSSITPGIATDLKFGGCGSYPNLPWVSTKGPGPNGRTISGVTYTFNSTQVKIVCACHGSHMFPEEFVRHASEGKNGDENGSGLASLSSNKTPSASAQS